jgi:hypothetical protein
MIQNIGGSIIERGARRIPSIVNVNASAALGSGRGSEVTTRLTR